MDVNESITLFLCGDVMTGRGIDQILPHPGDRTLYERFVRDARTYVRIAEEQTGPIESPVALDYIWGDALDVLGRLKPSARVINLETSVTASDAYWADKEIHYRMHPANVGCLTSARIDCCVLANNHVLDWGCAGLLETLETLTAAGIKTAGAGRDAEQAAEPAALTVSKGARVVVFAFGSPTSGVPLEWAARGNRPGVNVLADFSDQAVREVAATIKRHARDDDIVLVSIHWGPNWGYAIPAEQTAFARRLIDEAGVDVVHGHSSHHVKGIEIYKGRLILYGCGDFLNDYEGIGGYERFRPELTLMYFPTFDASTRALTSLCLAPMQVRRFRLNHARRADALWLRDKLNRECQRFDARVALRDDGLLSVDWSDRRPPTRTG